MSLASKESYKSICEVETYIPIFSQPWWLDAVCGKENWDVVIVENGEGIIGTLPYFVKSKMGMKLITQPILTQKLGPWIKYPKNQKYEARLSYEKKIINELLDQLPEVSDININCDYTLTNWLPFYWNGYSQSTRYTYVIDDLSNLDSVFSNFKSSTRGKIRKASKLVKVEYTEDINLFFSLNSKTFARQGLPTPYSYDLVENKDIELVKRAQRKIFIAKDDNGNIHSALYLIWDNRSSYVHMVGEDPELRSSGAGILLIWEAIQYTKERLNLNIFDFEGSMLESVEKVRRDCGAVQYPYFNICKTNNQLLKLYKALRS